MDNQPKQGKQRFSDYFYNRITYIGVGISSFVLVVEFFLNGIDYFAPTSSVYLDIFTYILLPPFFIVGLILIPLGARWKKRRVLQGLSPSHPKLIVVDPS